MIGRRRGARDDEGFALVFVMFVMMIVMAAVATTLTVTTPNIMNAKNDQDSSAALAAAQSGIDDVIAYLGSISACRSTTKICPQALGNSGSSTKTGTGGGPVGLSGTTQSYTWTTDPTLTADEYVRVHSTGRAGNQTKKLTADISLAPSILSFGYYTDYESQSPAFLYDYFAGRTVALTDSTTYDQINANNTSRRTVSVTSPTSVHWNGPATSGSNPYPASICGQHWYHDSSASPGRYTYGSSSVWGETGTINSNNMVRTASCDVVFTTGMTMDGPIYTRDAMLISDGTYGGVGPIFKQPVYTLWGFHGYDTPTPSATPWRQDTGVGGSISSTSPYKPAVAGLDLQLPADIGTDGLPANYCEYVGPTRVKLNGDGTATVTSPFTTAMGAHADPACYPSGPLSNGISRFTLNYKTAGSGVIYVKDLGTKPAAGWPANPTKSTDTPSASKSVLYLPTTGGATSPDVADNSTAPSAACLDTTYTSNDVLYKPTAAWPCAWTGVANATDKGTAAGWNAYTATRCSSAGATDRELFECEYGNQSSSTTPAVSQSGGYYKTFRTALQTDLARNTCLSGSGTDQWSCISGLINTDLAKANSGQHAYNYATPASGDHRYVVTGTPVVGSGTWGASRSVGSAPTNPMSSDPLFAYTGTPAQEGAYQTPMTFTVSRQVWSTTSGWTSSTPQFTLTDTQSDWQIRTNASGASYFPDTNDVTAYNTGTNVAGGVAGASGVNQPGDLYVEGTNSGKLSLIADNDVVVTNDVHDTSTDPNVDAVDIVAGGNVRNYHPVSCDDQTSADITSTDAGWCPNDITGLYNAILETNGVLWSSHPAMQYVNMTTPVSRTIDAAVFALSGSFFTDNYNRGVALGPLMVNGGIYQSHRGANGMQWEYRTSDTKRASSGYSLQYHYVDLEHASLPYAPPATGGSNTRVWNVVSISAGA